MSITCYCSRSLERYQMLRIEIQPLWFESDVFYFGERKGKQTIPSSSFLAALGYPRPSTPSQQAAAGSEGWILAVLGWQRHQGFLGCGLIIDREHFHWRSRLQQPWRVALPLAELLPEPWSCRIRQGGRILTLLTSFSQVESSTRQLAVKDPQVAPKRKCRCPRKRRRMWIVKAKAILAISSYPSLAILDSVNPSVLKRQQRRSVSLMRRTVKSLLLYQWRCSSFSFKTIGWRKEERNEATKLSHLLNTAQVRTTILKLCLNFPKRSASHIGLGHSQVWCRTWHVWPGLSLLWIWHQGTSRGAKQTSRSSCVTKLCKVFCPFSCGRLRFRL